MYLQVVFYYKKKNATLGNLLVYITVSDKVYIHFVSLLKDFWTYYFPEVNFRV